MCFEWLAVSNSSDRHPALPWEAKYSSVITIGRRMRFQGNEGNLLENSSNVKGLLDFALRDLPSLSQTWAVLYLLTVAMT